MGEFQNAVLAWQDKAMKHANLVLKYAVQELIEDIVKTIPEGGRMRVDTGFLRASLRAQLEVPIMQVITKPDGEEGSYPLDVAEVTLTINRMQIGQTLHVGFTANYARYREFGANGQPPDAFVRTHTAAWQNYISRAAARVRQMK